MPFAFPKEQLFLVSSCCQKLSVPYNPWKNGKSIPWNKSPDMKEWMTQSDPPKEATMFEIMDGRPQFFFSSKMIRYFIERTVPSVFFLKGNYK